MTAPVAASGRVAGVAGWDGPPIEGLRIVGPYRIVVFRFDHSGDWHWNVWCGNGVVLNGTDIFRAIHRETRLATAIRIRILAEQALEAHLVESLAALRGTP